MTVSRTISYQEHYFTRLHLLNGYKWPLKYKSREKVLYRYPARFIFAEFVHFLIKILSWFDKKIKKKMKKIYGKKIVPEFFAEILFLQNSISTKKMEPKNEKMFDQKCFTKND